MTTNIIGIFSYKLPLGFFLSFSHLSLQRALQHSNFVCIFSLFVHIFLCFSFYFEVGFHVLAHCLLVFFVFSLRFFQILVRFCYITQFLSHSSKPQGQGFSMSSSNFRVFHFEVIHTMKNTTSKQQERKWLSQTNSTFRLFVVYKTLRTPQVQNFKLHFLP